MDDLRLQDLISQVKRELLDYQTAHEGEEGLFEIRTVEIAATVTVKANADGKVSIGVVTVGAYVDGEHVHSVKLVFGVLDDDEEARGTPSPAPKSASRRVVRSGKKFGRRRR